LLIISELLSFCPVYELCYFEKNIEVARSETAPLNDVISDVVISFLLADDKEICGITSLVDITGSPS